MKDEDRERWESAAEMLRFYKFTAIYSAVMLTLILIVFVISELTE